MINSDLPRSARLQCVPRSEVFVTHPISLGIVPAAVKFRFIGLFGDRERRGGVSPPAGRETRPLRILLDKLECDCRKFDSRLFRLTKKACHPERSRGIYALQYCLVPLKMRRFFDSANAPLRMTYLGVQCKLAAKLEFDAYCFFAFS